MGLKDVCAACICNLYIQDDRGDKAKKGKSIRLCIAHEGWQCIPAEDSSKSCVIMVAVLHVAYRCRAWNMCFLWARRNWEQSWGLSCKVTLLTVVLTCSILAAACICVPCKFHVGVCTETLHGLSVPGAYAGLPSSCWCLSVLQNPARLPCTAWSSHWRQS